MFARGCVDCCSCSVTIAGSGPLEAVFSRSPSPSTKVCGVTGEEVIGEEAMGESGLEWERPKSSLLLRLSMFVRLDLVTPAMSSVGFGVASEEKCINLLLYRCTCRKLVPDLRDAFVAMSLKSRDDCDVMLSTSNERELSLFMSVNECVRRRRN